MTQVPQSFVARSVFDRRRLAISIAETYEFDVTSVWLISYGLNDHYYVECPGQDYVLRVYAPGWRTDAEVVAECEFIAHLDANNVGVAAPIRCRTGDFSWSIEAPEGPRTCVLFRLAVGPGATPQDGSVYGREMARLHEASDSFENADRKPMDIEFWLSNPVRSIVDASSPEGRQVVLSLEAELMAQFSEVDVAALGWGFCHGDLHGGNANVDGESATFYDFEYCGPTWRAFEMATFRWGMALRGDTDAWNQFCSGYREIRSVGGEELAATEVFMWMRHLWWIALQVEVRDFGTPSGWTGSFEAEAMTSMRTRNLHWF